MTKKQSLVQVCWHVLNDTVSLSQIFLSFNHVTWIANINDRSMKGDGDSEMVVCIQDEKFVDSQMDGQPYKAGEFAISLRLNLFRYIGWISNRNYA